MNRKTIAVAAAGASLLIAGIGAGLFAHRVWLVSSESAPLASALSASVAPTGAPPAFERVVSDLYGSKPAPRNERAIPWATHGFTFAGRTYFVAFVARKQLKADGTSGPECHACAPKMGAVTYKQDAGGWAVESRDPDIGEMGEYGEPPELPKSFADVTINRSPAFLAMSPYDYQGEIGTGAGVFLYRANQAGKGEWKFLGYIPIEERNEGTDACSERKICWSWKGDLHFSEERTNGIQEAVVVRRGTQLDQASGRVVPGMVMTYAVSEEGYQEKGKPSIAYPQTRSPDPTAAVATPTQSSPTSTAGVNTLSDPQRSQRIALSELRRMLATGSPAPAPRFLVDAMINGYDAPDTRLCERTTFGGLCDTRQDYVRVNVALPNAEARRALYDRRGRDGAPICARIEIGGRGEPNLLGFTPGQCH